MQHVVATCDMQRHKEPNNKFKVFNYSITKETRSATIYIMYSFVLFAFTNAYWALGKFLQQIFISKELKGP